MHHDLITAGTERWCIACSLLTAGGGRGGHLLTRESFLGLPICSQIAVGYRSQCLSSEYLCCSHGGRVLQSWLCVIHFSSLCRHLLCGQINSQVCAVCSWCRWGWMDGRGFRLALFSMVCRDLSGSSRLLYLPGKWFRYQPLQIHSDKTKAPANSLVPSSLLL